jgi:hypothetical protein
VHKKSWDAKFKACIARRDGHQICKIVGPLFNEKILLKALLLEEQFFS